MSLLHKDKRVQNNNNLLSATTPKETILNINGKRDLLQQTKLKQIIKINV